LTLPSVIKFTMTFLADPEEICYPLISLKIRSQRGCSLIGFSGRREGPVQSVQEIRDALAKADNHDAVALLVKRNQGSVFGASPHCANFSSARFPS
jgi:hypothetical protein